MTDQQNNQPESAAGEPTARSMRTVAMTALGGTSIEWYDFFIYGTAAALIFPTLFFAEDMPRYVSLIASFSTFAVGFLARPIGGVLFGHFGDRVGRKAALVTALMMMGVRRWDAEGKPYKVDIGPARGDDGAERRLPREVWELIFSFLIFEEGYRDARPAKRRRTL